MNLLNFFLRLRFRVSLRRLTWRTGVALVVWSSVFALGASDIALASKRFLARAWQSHDGPPPAAGGVGEEEDANDSRQNGG